MHSDRRLTNHLTQDTDIEKAREEHDAQMKARDEAHAALLETAKKVIEYCKFISTL
jgi:hypothetical protein